jgi:hypothetical protein
MFTKAIIPRTQVNERVEQALQGEEHDSKELKRKVLVGLDPHRVCRFQDNDTKRENKDHQVSKYVEERLNCNLSGL